MKPDFRILKDGDQILGIYDLTKISLLSRVSDTRYQIIIDSQFFTFTFPNKEICDRSFSEIIKEISKLNNRQD